MAKNTGFQQAFYAARFTAKAEIPLDKDGNFCSISGAKQAIILLEGHDNPNPTKYEVIGSFKEGDVIDGYPSMIYNTEACPLPEPEYTLPDYVIEPVESRYFRLNPSITSLNGEGYNVYAADWDKTPVEFSNGGENLGTYPTRRIGEMEIMLSNWKMKYHKDRNYGSWNIDHDILDASSINMTVDECYEKNGCYTFGGSATTRLFSGLEVYSKRYFTDNIKENLFDSSQISNFNVIDGKVVIDPNAKSFVINLSPAVQYTMSRDTFSGTFRIYRMWGTVTEGNDIVSFVEADKGNVITSEYSSYSLSYLFVFDTNNTTIKDLPDIKIEIGTTATDYIENKKSLQIYGWQVPYLEDYMQLLGTIGQDLSANNIMKHLFVSPNDKELPWINSFNISDKCEDLLGSRLVPCGHKRNTTLENGGKIFQFGERMALGLNSDQEIMPVIYFNMTAGYKVASVVYDNQNNIHQENASIKAWQRNYRFCRRLTDEELGYRLWVDEANDKILVTALTDTQPANTTELEKGLLRGLAVRWMNEDKTKVLASLSKLQAEIEKTKNDGEYNWYGFYE